MFADFFLFLEDPEYGPSVDYLSVSPEASLGKQYRRKDLWISTDAAGWTKQYKFYIVFADLSAIS